MKRKEQDIQIRRCNNCESYVAAFDHYATDKNYFWSNCKACCSTHIFPIITSFGFMYDQFNNPIPTYSTSSGQEYYWSAEDLIFNKKGMAS